MAGRRKKFPCGHVGKGQYCHRCAQEETRKRESAQAKHAWEEKLERAPLKLGHLPKSVAEKTLYLIANIRVGKTYMEFRGKRMKTIGQRHIISIPVGKHYRLIISDKWNKLQYLEVISHELYNKRLSSGGW